MFSNKAKVIYDVVNPIHSFSRIFGLTSFSIKKDNHKNYYGFVTFYDAFWLIISSLWSFFVVFWFVFQNKLFELNHEFLTKLFGKCFGVVAFSEVTIFLVTNWRFVFIKNEIINILKLIDEVDEELTTMNARVDLTSHQRFLKLFLILVTFFNMLGAFTSFITANLTGAYNPSIIVTLFDFFIIQLFVLLCSQFGFFMWSVKVRYFHVNRILEEKFCLTTVQNGKSLQMKSKTVTSIAILHEKIVRISECLSDCYGNSVNLGNSL